MLSIKKYINFNSAAGTDVKLFDIQSMPLAGICKFHKEDHSIFFLEETTLTYIAKGTKYMIVNGQEFFLKTNDLLCIPKNSVVFTYIPKQEPGFESINMLLTPTILQDKLPALNRITKPNLINSFISEPKQRSIKKTFLAFKKKLTHLNLTDLEKKAIYTNCIVEILNKIQVKDTHKHFRELKSEDLEKIKTVLIESIYKPMSIESIANQCHMSTSTFKRKFELTFGIPPKTWKRNICLQTAYFNLKTSNRKVSDIINSVGFENFSHFSYAFKKHFNFSPSAIAEQKLN